MNLIANRPKNWSGVAGQDHAIKVLKALLTTNRFLLRGYIFEGVKGVGKTTTAYLLARALMCYGIDPLGCGQAAIPCPSCSLIDGEGLDKHPDFREVDAASYSGVDHARQILEVGMTLPILGKRRVTMIDEAHRLSREAWDAYLKPLEAADTDTVFIFVTNEPTKIPDTISSRSCRIQFAKVAADVITGVLSGICSENSITYEQEALRLISAAARGSVRVAVKMLGIIASMGNVTVELVKMQLETTLEDGVGDLLKLVAARKHQEAIMCVDILARSYAPERIIEEVFAQYGRQVFTGDTTSTQTFGDVPTMTSFLIKWASMPRPTSDVLPLFIYEMMTITDPKTAQRPRAGNILRRPAAAGALTPEGVAEMLGAKIE